MLALGPLQHLLLAEPRRRSVTAQLNIPRFLAAVDALRIARAKALADDLASLVAP